MNFEDIDFSTWDPRNFDWSKLDPRAINLSEIDFDALAADGLTWAESEQGRQIIPVILLVLCVLIVWRVLRRRRWKDPSLARATRGTRLFGYTIILIFFGGFGTWSAVASLASAAIAPGVVSPEGSRKTVQHLEGGIVEKIHVKEGQTVLKGEPLVTLKNTRALARYEELQERQTYLAAVAARLSAEQKGAEELVFPPELQSRSDEAARAAITGQAELFQSTLEVQNARDRILGQRIAQLDEEISGLTELIGAQDEQLDLIGIELENSEVLMEKGLMRMPQYLALQRARAEITGQRATNKAEIARIRQQIGETELQLIATRQQAKEAAGGKLVEVRAELSTIRTQLPERIDTLARTEIVAPMSGRILDVRVTTETGGVIGAGEPILDIVPEDAALVLDARVRPQDVDTVIAGMRARIILTAFNQRYLPQVFGTVSSISADRLIDERTGEPYFLAKVNVDPQELEALGEDIKLVSGMPAEVMILTGEQTFFDIMAKPILESVRRSFRDAG
jgi:HlyD family secretion protein/epimerase transport system membrane fusion protein